MGEGTDKDTLEETDDIGKRSEKGEWKREICVNKIKDNLPINWFLLEEPGNQGVEADTDDDAETKPYASKKPQLKSTFIQEHYFSTDYWVNQERK